MTIISILFYMLLHPPRSTPLFSSAASNVYKRQLLHTPGHTPGSQCFLVNGNLVSGDTLFLEGCGRTDLPGSNPDDMYDSLKMLASLPGDTIVYPGHRYSDPAFLALGQVRETNYVFKPTTKEGWLQWFGH